MFVNCKLISNVMLTPCNVKRIVATNLSLLCPADSHDAGRV